MSGVTPTVKAVDRVLLLLSKRGEVKRRGAGWKCRCPGHDDAAPSLDVDLGHDGRVLFCCRSAGCRPAHIALALGLTMADLFDNRTTGKLSFEDRVEHAYDYRDEGGTLLFQAVRLCGPKNFRQRRPEGKGTWVWKLDGVRRVLYRLPELIAADKAAWVFVVEGEKDADALTRLGLVATTNPMGAGKWKAEYAEQLRGLRVVVIPDNDEPGRQHAEAVRQSLQGVALRVVHLELPDLPEKGDVSDWLATGGTAAALLQLVEARARVNPCEARVGSSALAPGGRAAPASAIVSRSLAEVEHHDIEWLWPGWLPAGMLSILDGDPSEGKSLITIDAAARLSRGGQMPFAAGAAAPACVLIMAAEDSAEHTIKPRAIAAGADVALVRVCECVRIGAHERPIRLPEDLDAIEREIVATKARLLVIDPLLGFLSQAVDSHKDQSVRDVLHQLKLLAARTGCAVLGLRHLGKANAGGNALYRGMGSIAITAAARSAFTVGAHPSEEGVRVMACTKLNLTAKPRSLAYRIKDDFGKPVIDWLYPCDVTAADLGVPTGRAAAGGAIEQAKEFLRATLAGGAERLSTDIEAKAKEIQLSWSTVRRASVAIGVKAEKRGFSGRWVWSLPAEGAQAPDGPEGAQNISD